MLTDDLRAAFTSSSQGEFMSGIRSLLKALPKASHPAVMLLDVFAAIPKGTASESEQAHRAAKLIREVQRVFPITPEVIAVLSDLPVAIRNGIASAAPPNLIRGLFREFLPSQPAQPDQVRPLPQEPERSPSAGGNPHITPVEYGTVVLLLSTEDNQEANIHLLAGNGFAAFRVTSRSGLAQYLEEADVCGFVVDASFWRSLTASDQDDVLLELIHYSSFTCLAIDTRDFHDPEGIWNVIERERVGTPQWFHAIVRDTSTLVAADLACFRRASEHISTADKLAFLPSELTPEEQVALTGACRAFFKEEYARSEEALTSLAVRSVHSGLSSAKTMLIRFNNAGIPVFVKLGCRERVMDEIVRYDRYIRREDRILRPCFHYHAEVGVIIFGLIERDTDPLLPAPSLDDEVQSTLAKEVWDEEPTSVDAACASIDRVIERTCEMIAQLNARPADGEHESQAYLRGSGIRNLEAKGVRWEIGGLDGRSLSQLLEQAYVVLERIGSRATVHGDLHLHNVLVPRSGVPDLIDFAYTGPGHPAYDLVRFEAALVFRYLLPLGPEEEFLALQRALSVDLLDEHALRSQFPVWWSSKVNTTLLRGAVRCRDAALGVLRPYGGDTSDYWACKFVVSSWSLTIPGLQLVLVRATLASLAPGLTN